MANSTFGSIYSMGNLAAMSPNQNARITGGFQNGWSGGSNLQAQGINNNFNNNNTLGTSYVGGYQTSYVSTGAFSSSPYARQAFSSPVEITKDNFLEESPTKGFERWLKRSR